MLGRDVRPFTILEVVADGVYFIQHVVVAEVQDAMKTLSCNASGWFDQVKFQ